VGVAQFLDCDDAYSSGLLSGIPIATLPFNCHHTLVVGIIEGPFLLTHRTMTKVFTDAPQRANHRRSSVGM
jgi:hypothetical protein